MTSRRLKPVLVLLAAFLVVSGLQGRALAQSAGRQAGSLIEALGGRSWNQASTEFDNRVRQRFPIGTPLGDMTEALRKEGFVPVASELPGWNEHMLRRDGPVCRVSARILWQADAAARLTHIQGFYREEGCL